MYRQWIDPSTTSTLALCTCGWRALVSTRSAAWKAGNDHATHAHPGQAKQSADAYHQAVKRERARD